MNGRELHELCMVIMDNPEIEMEKFKEWGKISFTREQEDFIMRAWTYAARGEREAEWLLTLLDAGEDTAVRNLLHLEGNEL